MSSTTVVLNGVREGRRQNDPTSANRYGFVGYLPINEVLKLRRGGPTPWDAEPRWGSAKSKMGKIISESLKDGEVPFHLVNRGITLIADSGKLDHEVLTLTFDGEKRGVVDGGTTITAIVSVLDEGTLDGEPQFVPLRVFSGLWEDDLVERAAEGVNTSRQVNAFDLANFRDQFDWLKPALTKLPNGIKVQYFDGQFDDQDGADLVIDDVLQVLTLVISDDPHKAYLSKKYCLDHYKSNPSEYQRYADVVAELLKMTEQIPVILHSKVPKFLTHPVTGGPKKVRTLPLTGETIRFSPRMSWVFPMLAAMKADLDTESERVKWKVPPATVLPLVATTLFEFVNSTYKFYKKQNAVGRDVNLYGRCFDKVEVIVEKLQSKSAVA